MPGQPHLPQNWRSSPVGGVTRYRKATANIWRELKDVRKWLLSRWMELETSKVEVNALHINATYYEYQIDLDRLDQIIQEMQDRINTQVDSQQFSQSVMSAYEAGTGAAVANLASISDDYTREITQVLTSEPYRRRAALIEARVFEEMEGFKGDVGKDLGRVLRQAVESGESPLDTANTIRQRFGVSHRRAERIARTEVTNSLRKARWDEAMDAQERLGMNVRMLWLSALSPTTRRTHAAQHGEVMGIQEVADWYNSHQGSRINCKCAQTEIIVDDEGNPVTPGVVEKVRREKRQEESP